MRIAGRRATTRRPPAPRAPRRCGRVDEARAARQLIPTWDARDLTRAGRGGQPTGGYRCASQESQEVVPVQLEEPGGGASGGQRQDRDTQPLPAGAEEQHHGDDHGQDPNGLATTAPCQSPCRVALTLVVRPQNGHGTPVSGPQRAGQAGTSPGTCGRATPRASIAPPSHRSGAVSNSTGQGPAGGPPGREDGRGDGRRSGREPLLQGRCSAPRQCANRVVVFVRPRDTSRPQQDRKRGGFGRPAEHPIAGATARGHPPCSEYAAAPERRIATVAFR